MVQDIPAVDVIVQNIKQNEDISLQGVINKVFVYCLFLIINLSDWTFDMTAIKARISAIVCGR